MSITNNLPEDEGVDLSELPLSRYSTLPPYTEMERESVPPSYEEREQQRQRNIFSPPRCPSYTPHPRMNLNPEPWKEEGCINEGCLRKTPISLAPFCIFGTMFGSAQVAKLVSSAGPLCCPASGVITGAACASLGCLICAIKVNGKFGDC